MTVEVARTSSPSLWAVLADGRDVGLVLRRGRRWWEAIEASPSVGLRRTFARSRADAVAILLSADLRSRQAVEVGR